MAIFTSCGMYIATATSKQQKIARYNEIITALEAAALNAAGNEAGTMYEEYKIDTGQNIIQTRYRTAEQMAKGIEVFIRLRNNAINDLNGHSFRLVDSKNFKR